jgi:hypothetical protein
MISQNGRKMIIAIFVLVIIFWGLGKASDLGLIDEVLAGFLLDFLKVGIPLAAIWTVMKLYNYFKNGKAEED